MSVNDPQQSFSRDRAVPVLAPRAALWGDKVNNEGAQVPRQPSGSREFLRGQKGAEAGHPPCTGAEEPCGVNRLAPLQIVIQEAPNLEQRQIINLAAPLVAESEDLHGRVGALVPAQFERSVNELPRQAGPSNRVTFVPSFESDADAHY